MFFLGQTCMAALPAAKNRRQRSVVVPSVLLGCIAGSLAGWLAPKFSDGGFVPPVAGISRRAAALSWAAGGTLLGSREAQAFTPADLGGGSTAGIVEDRQSLPQVDLTEEALQENLYYISRVQEATVQQERLVSTGKFKDTQRNNIRMALRMMLENYKLGDNVVAASAYAEPKSNVFPASQAGKEAIEVLETCREYFAKDLKVSGLTDDQRKFILEGMQQTRTKLDSFLTYMPADVVQKARKQVEDENAMNLKEFVNSNGEKTILNPVVLPWQQKGKKA